MGGRKGSVTDRKLHRLYYNVSHPASFSSVLKLAKAAKVSPQLVREWLKGEEVYTTHFPARKRSVRTGFYNAYYPNATWEVDLSDMSKLVQWNKGYSYILVVIDIFNKQIQARALKSKESSHVASAMNDIFEVSGVSPQFIQSDEGGEFIGKPFQDLLKQYKVKFRIARNQHKASICERVQRTLKSKMWKWFAHKETYTWVDVLPKLISSYNNSPHSSLGGLSPNQVEEKHFYKIWKDNYLRHFSKSQGFNRSSFAINDFVRISKYKKHFEKGYTQSYTTEVFKISRVFRLRGVYMYELKSLLNEQITGKFYPDELIRVYYTPDASFKIESVLNRRQGADGQEESFVKWKGWHSSHNSWIPSAWIKGIHSDG
jgi:hypothetical protein